MTREDKEVATQAICLDIIIIEMHIIPNQYILPLGLFLLIGLYSCYTDIKYRRIKNWMMVWGIVIGLFLHLVFSSGGPSQGAFFLNLGLGVAIALLLWRLNIWAAGDGKFFIFSSIFLLVIFNMLSGISLGGTPLVFIVLLNAFVLGFLYLFLETLVACFGELHQHWQRRELPKLARDALSKLQNPELALSQLKVLLFYLAAIIFFSSLKGYIYRFIPLGGKYYFFFYLILLLLYPALRRRLARVRIVYLTLILSLLVLVLSLDMTSILKSAFKFFLILGAIRAFVNWFIEKREIKVLRPQDLRPNVLLAKEEIANLPSIQRQGMRFFSDGLTPEQAEQLKLYFQAQSKEAVRVYNTFPFAPFIVLAVITTCLLEGRLINILFFL